MKRYPLGIVMSALDAGLEVTFGNHTYAFKTGYCLSHEDPETADPDRKLLMLKMSKWPSGESHWINPDMTINDFMDQCSLLSYEYVLELSMNTALNGAKSGR